MMLLLLFLVVVVVVSEEECDDSKRIWTVSRREWRSESKLPPRWDSLTEWEQKVRS